mmetsp:Transcript_1044/g.2548  ORF Transcript_1044/g.2548 Transcript_1044/m.2548 type:complete len:181 (+) Transcript_1044:347-889(+)
MVEAAKILGHELSNLAELLKIDAGANTEPVEHVYNVLGGYVSGSTLGKRAATKPTNRTIYDANAVLEGHEDIGQGLPVCIMKMNSNLFLGNVLRNVVKEYMGRSRCTNADGITEADFVAAHIKKPLANLEYLLRRNVPLVGAAQDTGDVASDTDAMFLGLFTNWLEALKALGDITVKVLL